LDWFFWSDDDMADSVLWAADIRLLEEQGEEARNKKRR
jgi:hypothetical protein